MTLTGERNDQYVLDEVVVRGCIDVRGIEQAESQQDLLFYWPKT